MNQLQYRIELLRQRSLLYSFLCLLFSSFSGFSQKCNHASEVQTLFSQLKNSGFDESKPIGYHYFFLDTNPKDIAVLKDELLKQDYQYVGIAKVSGKYQLEVSKTEAHTAASAIEKGKEMKALAVKNNVDVFDGFELKMADEEERTVDLRQEIEKTPPHQLFKKALAFYDRSDYGNAIIAFDRCIKLGINSEASYYKRGNSKTNLGKVNEAIADLEDVLRLNPNHYEANFNLGGLHLDKENYDKAISHYQKAVSVNPKSDNGFYRLAVAYQKKGQKNMAIQQCQKSLEVNPDNVYAQDLMSRLK